MRRLLEIISLLAALSAPAMAASLAGVSFCGGNVVAGDPTDMENQPGEMTLQAAVDQPAGITTCGKGYLLAKCGDHENANKIFDKCIAAGYVGAMIWKALQFENGNGTAQDLKAAAELLRRAAHSDDPAYGPIGRLHYATILHEGRGVARDAEEALKWFRRAAAEGNPEAAEFLRTGYHTGARDRQAMGAGTPTAAATAALAAGPQPSEAPLRAVQPAPVPIPAARVALRSLAANEALLPPPPVAEGEAPAGIRLMPQLPADAVRPVASGALALLLAAFAGGLAFRRRASDRALRVRFPLPATG